MSYQSGYVKVTKFMSANCNSLAPINAYQSKITAGKHAWYSSIKITF